MTTKHVTINIGPQDSESWLFFAVAIGVASIFWSMAYAVHSEQVTKRVEIQAHQHP